MPDDRPLREDWHNLSQLEDVLNAWPELAKASAYVVQFPNFPASIVALDALRAAAKLSNGKTGAWRVIDLPY